MKLLTLAFAIVLSLVPAALGQKIPISENVEEALVDYFKKSLFLKKFDGLGSSFSEAFEGVEVYELWREDRSGDSISSSSMQLLLVTHGEEVKITAEKSERVEYLVKLYDKPLGDKEAVTKLFKALGSVEEVIKKGNAYHIFTGETFFDGKSGYVLTLNDDGSVESCIHHLKLSELE